MIINIFLTYIWLIWNFFGFTIKSACHVLISRPLLLISHLLWVFCFPPSLQASLQVRFRASLPAPVLRVIRPSASPKNATFFQNIKKFRINIIKNDENYKIYRNHRNKDFDVADEDKYDKDFYEGENDENEQNLINLLNLENSIK